MMTVDEHRVLISAQVHAQFVKVDGVWRDRVSAMNDRKGKSIGVGDKVLVEFTITAVRPETNTVVLDTPGHPETIAIPSSAVEKQTDVRSGSRFTTRNDS